MYMSTNVISINYINVTWVQLNKLENSFIPTYRIERSTKLNKTYGWSVQSKNYHPWWFFGCSTLRWSGIIYFKQYYASYPGSLRWRGDLVMAFKLHYYPPTQLWYTNTTVPKALEDLCYANNHAIEVVITRNGILYFPEKLRRICDLYMYSTLTR